MSVNLRFSIQTKKNALLRQMNLCGSCGTNIHALGVQGKLKHEFGESAHAHHIRHVKFVGTNTVGNCIILCEACHYIVHEGGNYRHGTVIGTPKDFLYYWS